ncbi:PREDICTED: uncharacterized protein K02A2.6-like [Paramuricea clavata]|uniref:PREDICTED: uncharacterized protein K02A2.6-like n=1 Tax=Paramuricea clavata TaxID=317549 RepID=A0A7D9IVU9_PARCT|nr:PREDICTED: uncharacterized protein K02A2.6-like [Paramuricea clavata]
MIEKCIPCQAATSTKHHEPLQMTKLPDGPWQKLSADFCGPLSSAKATIPKFDKILSTHGIPIEIKTDNGPPFNSQEFKTFSEDLGFSHRNITPLSPKANAEAERFMQTLNKAIITAHTEQLNWKQQLYRFLRNYRAIPHASTDKTHAELLFGRKMRIKLPEVSPTVIDSDLRCKDATAKRKMKEYADDRNNAKPATFQIGDDVLVRQRKQDNTPSTCGSTTNDDNGEDEDIRNSHIEEPGIQEQPQRRYPLIAANYYRDCKKKSRIHTL